MDCGLLLEGSIPPFITYGEPWNVRNDRKDLSSPCLDVRLLLGEFLRSPQDTMHSGSNKENKYGLEFRDLAVYPTIIS